MAKKEVKKIKKELQQLHYDCTSGPITYDSYFYIGDFKVEDGRYARWFFNDDFKKIKKHILYITILFETKLNLNANLINSLLSKKKIETDDLLNNEREFETLFKKADSSVNIEELKKALIELVDYVNKAGVDLKVNVYKNAKDALPKAIEIDQLAGEDEYSFSSLLLELIEFEKREITND